MTDLTREGLVEDTMRFRLIQDGMPVAGCEGPAVRAMNEAAHYLMVYGQDGPCKLQFYTKGRRWRDVREGELENAIAFRARAMEAGRATTGATDER